MSHITTFPLRNPQQYFGRDCYPDFLAHSSIEHARLETENNILRRESESWKRQAQAAMADRGEIALKLAEAMERERDLLSGLAMAKAKNEFLAAQLERADAIQTTQRLRIDELIRDRDAANKEIIDRDATVATLVSDLSMLRGPSFLRGECDA